MFLVEMSLKRDAVVVLHDGSLSCSGTGERRDIRGLVKLGRCV